MNTEKLIETAIRAAISAGDEILEVYHHADFELEFKADNSPLTIADKRAHQVITQILAETGLPILSEEGLSVSYAERKQWPHFWLVDPLDGTKEFVKRNDEFTVNIALIQGDTPIGGVVFVPVTRTIYWASKGGSFRALIESGSFALNTIRQLPVITEKEHFTVAGSRSHMSRETEAFILTLDTGGKAIEMISKGSSLKICMVAEGLADVYPRLGPTMEWDTAAGHAIVKFAGKEIFQFENDQTLKYNKENLLNPWFVVK